MTQKIRCSKCGEILYVYKGNKLKSPSDIIEQYKGKCPECDNTFGPTCRIYVRPIDESPYNINDLESVEISIERLLTYRNEYKTKIAKKKEIKKNKNKTVPNPPLKLSPMLKDKPDKNENISDEDLFKYLYFITNESISDEVSKNR